MKLLVVVVAVSFSNLVYSIISKTTSPYALSPFPFLFPSFAVFIEIQIRLFFLQLTGNLLHFSQFVYLQLEVCYCIAFTLYIEFK
jgi:hypothetical protein